MSITYVRSRYIDKIWGGSRMVDYFDREHPSPYIGESHEVHSTSNPQYPVSVKYIDAADNLSVQLHSKGKTEVWYVLEAAPDAKIYAGFNQEMSAKTLSDAIANQNVLECLNEFSVQPNDSIIIPSGMIHCIGKGVLLAEVSTVDPTTYRVYDFNRDPRHRPLNIEEGLLCADYSVSKPDIIRDVVDACVYQTPEMSVSIRTITEWELIEIPPESFSTLQILKGSGDIIDYDGHGDALRKGDSIVIAPLDRRSHVNIFSDSMRILFTVYQTRKQGLSVVV